MPFVKGQAKVGGRVAGSQNKETLAKKAIFNNLWDEMAEKVTGDGLAKCWAEMEQLTGKDYIHYYMAMLEYFKPKLQRSQVDNSHKFTTPIIIDWTGGYTGEPNPETEGGIPSLPE